MPAYRTRHYRELSGYDRDSAQPTGLHHCGITLPIVGKLWDPVGDACVDYLNQSSSGSSRWFHIHIQLPLSLATWVLFDSFMLRYRAMTTIYQTGQHVVDISRFEFAIFAMLFIYTTVQYAVALGEIYRNQTRPGTETGRVISELAQLRLSPPRIYERQSERTFRTRFRSYIVCFMVLLPFYGLLLEAVLTTGVRPWIFVTTKAISTKIE